ncbi:MAG: hypothetical protein WA584_08955 [Pyrinomonadaceae bacterium]
MPKNANILMVRHGEKPAKGDKLSVAGEERAQAYSIYFQNYEINSKVISLDYIIAAKDSNVSHRPRLTIEPLAKALNLTIEMPYKDKEYGKYAPEILSDPNYDNSSILICWHHGEILDFAKALGADGTKLPPSSNFPVGKWNPAVFGWVLQLCYDANGDIIPSQTICINEKLMFDDHGKNPPAVMEKLKPSRK